VRRGDNGGCDDDVCDSRWWEGVGGESFKKRFLSKRYYVIPRITIDVAKATKNVRISVIL